jgi:hypothetical protein
MRLRYPDVGAPAAPNPSGVAQRTHPPHAPARGLRTTEQKRPGQPATGALWFTWSTGTGVRAGKLNALPVSPGGHGIVVGEPGRVGGAEVGEPGPGGEADAAHATQGPAGSRGTIALADLHARWDVAFAPRSGPLGHLAPAALYRAPLPRTKATSPVPDLDATGTLTIDGETIDLTGWTGMLGHNWGTEHAARWIWLRAAGLGADAAGGRADAAGGGADGDGWLDVILGRVRVGPVLTPWTAFGTLYLDGRRHRLGGLLNRGTAVALHPGGADITLTGGGVTVVTRATVALSSTVGWQYADPAGGRHEVVNCSVAEMTLDVVRDGRRLHLSPVVRGVLEVGGDERAFDVPLQPFPD